MTRLLASKREDARDPAGVGAHDEELRGLNDMSLVAGELGNPEPRSRSRIRTKLYI
jgi:hypothetical protein